MRYKKLIKKFPFVNDPDLIPQEDIEDVGNGLLLQLVRENGFTASIFQAYDKDKKLKNKYGYIIYPNFDDEEPVDIKGIKDAKLLGEIEIENNDRKTAWIKTVDTINERFLNLCKEIEEAYLATAKKIS